MLLDQEYFKMQVTHQIDKLISSLNELKPLLSEDKTENAKQFSELLLESLEDSSHSNKNLKMNAALLDQKNANEIPHWVDQDYGYDPENPRKPNMRELMEAISGKSVETLYSEPAESWTSVSNNASEILYGVVDTSSDPRDWSKIMAADDTLAAARAETGMLHDPKIHIESIFTNGELTNQIAILKDKKGNNLRVIPADTTLANETLRNFGATSASVPKNIEDKVIAEKFNGKLLNFLKNFDKSSSAIQQLVVQSASEVMANKISQEIPLYELAKL